jgi:ligand-binding sensor domain-containing protein
MNYQRKYPEFMFEDFPITDLAASPSGDTLYIGTRGAGVSRVYRDEVDAISGASEYAEWGPIKMPSDHVTCLYVEADGTQWIGTDKGVARHRGHDGMENWFVLDQSTGLINNHVQCIAKDHQERIWIGTRAGISVFAKDAVSSFGREQGLLGENVQCIAVDHDGIIWIGTDRGVTSYYQGDVIRYYNR